MTTLCEQLSAKLDTCCNGNGNGNGNGNNSNELYHNLVISNAFIKINEILCEYAKGNFMYVIENLSFMDYSALSKELHMLEYKNNPDYEKIRGSLIKALEGLLQCVYQTTTCADEHTQMLMYKEGYDILHNQQLLNDYLESLKNRFSAVLLPEISITAKRAMVKPEILRYIQMYGFPCDAIFNPDRLAEVIEILKEEAEAANDPCNCVD